MMGDSMYFPDSVDEYMDSYKVVDTKEVYTNGTELVPIFRMRQWFRENPKSDYQRGRADALDELVISLNPCSECPSKSECDEEYFEDCCKDEGVFSWEEIRLRAEALKEQKTCADCILDQTDACTRGAGRAVDDEICKEFLEEQK